MLDTGECFKDDCGKPVVARGLCRRHYGQAHHAKMLDAVALPVHEVEPAERFLALADVSGADDCWVWRGGTYPGGYGQFWYQGRNHTAHRVSHLLFIGPLQPGQVVCHRCDVKACVNPAHLFAGTQAVNIADKVEKDHQAKGESHGNAKLTTEQVQMVRTLFAAGHRQIDIARALGLSRSAVYSIVRGRSWKHV